MEIEIEGGVASVKKSETLGSEKHLQIGDSLKLLFTGS